MEVAQDFGWATAKGAHALILCSIEEGKVDCLSFEKLTRPRRAHAQKLSQIIQIVKISQKTQLRSKGSHVKFFQSAKCSHKTDHTISGQLYRHICSH